MLVASLIVWIFLNVKHEELATDGPRSCPPGSDLSTNDSSAVSRRFSEVRPQTNRG